MDLLESDSTKVNSAITRSVVEKSFLLNASSAEQKSLEIERQRRIEAVALQNTSQGNRSTFGSVDEDGLIHASDKVELEMGPEVLSTTRIMDSQRLSTLADGRIHQDLAANSGQHRVLHDANMALTASFPPRKSFGTDRFLNDSMLRPRTTSADTSPAKESPKENTTNGSPSKESHWIRDIPKQNLFVDVAEQDLHGIPYFILFICQRIATACSISLRQLAKTINLRSVCSCSDTFWSAIREHSDHKLSLQQAHESSRIWQAAKHQFIGYTFKGQISFNSKEHSPVFSLQLSPVNANMSCRFERKFGSDRFIYLDAPVFNAKQSPRFNTSHELERIRFRWNQWLLTEHEFLGRKWRAFHIKSLKKSKGSRKDATHDKRYALFATEGWGIQNPMTIGEMLNWFFPISLNRDQSFCKTFARLDLGFTRAVPTLVFKPSQIKFVQDTEANGEMEDAVFNDSRLSWDEIPPGNVMNDGCSEMSVGAAREIWRLYKVYMRLEDRLPLPSVFQGRIGGAKGLWMISGETFSRDPEHTEIWIKISDSQRKFLPHESDRHDETYDKFRLTFEVRDYSSSPSPSDLHISFIPIMFDRGIPKETIADFMNECLDADRSQLLDVVTDPLKMHDWIYRNGSKSSNGNDVAWQASSPAFLEDRISFLLESGFDPSKFLYLAEGVGQFIAKRQNFQEMSLRTPLGKSTYLFGVADPLGVLKPGEIHVQFSTRFIDNVTGDSYLNLRNLEVLVARQPACRRSDIQKVRAVVCLELEHLIDVVVFPSRGERPLAGKLQGGDYDGDIFWLCWEPRLVAGFKNAPAPVQDPEPKYYGIQTNKEKLKEIMDTRNLREVDAFLKKAFEFRSHPSLLGMVTTFLEKQAYRENKISSSTLDLLCDLHDLLVDAPKQGYTFTFNQFQGFVKNVLKLRKDPKDPHYKIAMDACKPIKESSGVNGGGKLVEPPAKARNNSNQLLDYLYFDVLQVHNRETLKRIDEFLSKASMADDALYYPYEHLKDKNDDTFNEVLDSLRKELDKLYGRWALTFKNALSSEKKGISIEQENALVDECYRKFRAIRPIHKDHSDIESWLKPYSGPASISWDYIRASALYVMLSNKKKAHFAFKMAGRELAQMKAESFVRVRHIIPRIHANMRPKRIKAPIDFDEEEEDGSEDEYGSSVGFVGA